jgi:5-methylthioribose kinase
MKKELFDDKELQLEAAKLKYSFMNNAQALIHGDLHTGSIFVLPESTKIIDPEFAFFGPVGYDLGTLIANLCIAWVNAYVLYNDGERKEEFMVWLEGCISEVVDRFIEKFFVAFTTMCMDPMGKVPGYAQWLIESIIHDAAGMAGLEIIRRVVGIAPVPDIISIVDMPKRTLAERILVHAAKNLMINRALLGRGGQFVNTIQSAAHALSECLNP